MSRRPFLVVDAMREKVRYLAGVGVPQDDIAKMIGCAPKTLRKRFRDEIDRGIAEANATMVGYLFAAAKDRNIAAIIFWLKTRARWRENGPPAETRSGEDANPRSQVLVVLPDNGRDPGLTKVLKEAQQKAQAKYFRKQQKKLR